MPVLIAGSVGLALLLGLWFVLGIGRLDCKDGPGQAASRRQAQCAQGAGKGGGGADTEEPSGTDAHGARQGGGRVLVDPVVPDEAIDVFAGRSQLRQVVLTSGHHSRDAAVFADAFGCVVRAPRAGVRRLDGTLKCAGLRRRRGVAPTVTGLEIGRIAPDDGALHLEIAEGAIVFADALNRHADALMFFPDDLLGNDPPAVKRALTQAFEGLLTHEFDHLLFAHGTPLIGGGKAALRALVKQQGAG